MAVRRMGIIVFLLCVCLSLMPCQVLAVSTADAVEQISTNQVCSLTVSYHCDGMAFADMPVKLYKIADVSVDYQYTLTASFTSSGLALNGISSIGEWNVIRSTLESNIIAYELEADTIAETDQAGQVCFEGLKPGLYLAVTAPVTQNNLRCSFQSALVALPGLGSDGCWQYETSVSSKPEIITPTEEDIQLKVLKLWKGDNGRRDRPRSITVEIFRDGVSYQTVVLSENNYWTYSWTAKKDGSKWTVTERNIPKGYTLAVEERGNSFILTNVRIPGNVELPRTGDTSNVLLYILLMYLSGSLLIILGMVGKKKHA